MTRVHPQSPKFPGTLICAHSETNWDQMIKEILNQELPLIEF